MVSEANHYTLFLGYARKYMDKDIVDKKWDALLAFEAEMMKERGNSAKIHGQSIIKINRNFELTIRN